MRKPPAASTSTSCLNSKVKPRRKKRAHPLTQSEVDAIVRGVRFVGAVVKALCDLVVTAPA